MLTPAPQTTHTYMKWSFPVTGRPYSFIPTDALRHALEAFWEKGYKAASLDDPTGAIHLSRLSFYVCFGSKHTVFMGSVELCADELFAGLKVIAASGLPPSDAIHAVLSAIADIDAGNQGCFFVNYVTKLAPRDSALTAFSRHHTARVSALVGDLLVRAGSTQELAQVRDAALLALASGTVTLRSVGIPAPQLPALLNQAHLLPADSPSST